MSDPAAPVSLQDFLEGGFGSDTEERVVKPIVLDTADGESYIRIVIDYPEGYAIDAARAIAAIGSARSIGDFVLRAAEDEDASAVALLHDGDISLDSLRENVDAAFADSPILTLDDAARLF